MQEITNEQLKKGDYLLFIYSPFCGTCHVARSMLEKIESVHHENIFVEMNASLYPDFMQDNQIESVPCLLIMQDNEIKEKVYAFRSIANIYNYLLSYKPALFAKS
ncbi:thiol-disulfide isomerase/thioredoxin [Virgibacillus halotolerans]|uniref:thioredoxin family protein n=1 Tax=Virgibacillus halotolerans TaxID=1071053 RepID=UPI001960C4E8|nr:thioredoxin family protein [Virgibacillus halotolerans]MBM7600650.1 thiol-disulfide isomerase/thioredoxin [Virgibacillus halotolerans]